MPHNFRQASPELSHVFGASRPGCPSESVSEREVQEWIASMKEQGIRRVCCLLEHRELKWFRTDLLEAYRRGFGERNVCHSPIVEHAFCEDDQWAEVILPFLKEGADRGEAVVVHCSLGIGRTGQVLRRAIEALRDRGPGASR